MRPRFPITLWKHLLWEQVKLLLLTVSIVVVVIAFATAIDPIADGKLAPADLPRYILLAIPPMLAYALPFSAGFAATLAYHRLNQDNETIGAYASGVSHRTLVGPALALGLTLALTLVALNDQVIPRFLREMQRLVTRDLVRLIGRSIETGEPVVVGDWVITADKAYVLPEPPEGYLDQARLTRVVAMELGKTQTPDALHVVAVGSSAQADLWLRQTATDNGSAREGTEAIIELGQTVAQRRGDVALAYWESATFGPLFFPDGFSEEPEFLTSAQLLALRKSPDDMAFIAFRKRYLAHAMAEPRILEIVSSTLEANEGPEAAGEWLRFGFVRGGGRVQILGRGIRPSPEGWIIEPWDRQGVRVEYFAPRAEAGSDPSEAFAPENSSLRRDVRLLARTALLRINLVRDERNPELTITLELRNAVEDTLDPAGARERLVFSNLKLAENDPIEDLDALPVTQLLDMAWARIVAQEPGFESLIRPHGDLLNRLQRLQREIIGKLNERVALAASCLVMVITGALAALRLHRSSPLAVYAASFLPALLSLILINGGQSYVHRTGLEGLILMWAGIAIPAALALWLYRSVARH